MGVVRGTSARTDPNKLATFTAMIPERPNDSQGSNSREALGETSGHRNTCIFLWILYDALEGQISWKGGVKIFEMTALAERITSLVK